MGQAFARQGPKVARLDAKRADQIWQSRFEVPRQIPREGALIVALGIIGAILNQCTCGPDLAKPLRSPPPDTARRRVDCSPRHNRGNTQSVHSKIPRQLLNRPAGGSSSPG